MGTKVSKLSRKFFLFYSIIFKALLLSYVRVRVRVKVTAIIKADYYNGI
jgi:hypothetical protein